MLWSLDETIQDHADGVAILRFKEEQEPRIMYAASDAGVLFVDLKGNIMKWHFIGHGQNQAIANFRDDLAGLESFSINFWGNQGIIHYYDPDWNIYHDFEPNQYGSMCLPLNWTGKSEDFLSTHQILRKAEHMMDGAGGFWFFLMMGTLICAMLCLTSQGTVVMRLLFGIQTRYGFIRRTIIPKAVNFTNA